MVSPTVNSDSSWTCINFKRNICSPDHDVFHNKNSTFFVVTTSGRLLQITSDGDDMNVQGSLLLTVK